MTETKTSKFITISLFGALILMSLLSLGYFSSQPISRQLKGWEIFIGGIATLAIYSFLVKENPVYRFFEHLYIGIATGITVVLGFKTFLWPKFFKPLLGFSVQTFPDGSIYQPYNNYILLYLLPMCLGLLYYCILTKRYAWLAQIAIGFSLGASGGLAFKGFFNQVIPQLVDSFKSFHISFADLSSISLYPFKLPAPVFQAFSNFVFMTVLLSSFFYFFFTFKREEGGVVERFSTTGRWMMMGCFGAFFGTTIMARMSLLVERIQFFIDEWVPTVFSGVIS